MKTTLFSTIKLVLCLILMTGFYSTSAQVLDLESTTEGALMPRMTTAQRTAIPTPAQSLLVYDMDTKSFWYYDNSQWNELGSSGGTAASDEIKDADNDTKIQVEKNTDEDNIRFDVGGTEAMKINPDGYLSIGTSVSPSNLTIADTASTELRIGAQEFNMERSGKLIFDEDVDDLVGTCGFQFELNGVDNTLSLSGGCYDLDTIVVFNRTGPTTFKNTVTATAFVGDGSGLTGLPSGGGSGTFYYDFSSFSNSSCCNNMIFQQSNSVTAAASIFDNSTQPKHAYGKPLSYNVEIVSVKFLHRYDVFLPTGGEALNIQPAIASLDGTLDRWVTAPVDLRTAPQDVWIDLPLTSAVPADNLVDAGALQYIVWRQNTLMSGGGDLDGICILQVEVKIP